jgi:predicted anti-sigma-YlaC factor YlaD
MNNDCAKFKDLLLEAALTGVPGDILKKHLQDCGNCTSEFAALQARRERLEALLPLLAREQEPSAGFRARVLAAAESAREHRSQRWRVWILTGAAAAIVAALTIGLALQRRNSRTLPEGDLIAAKKLAEWRAPSDVLLMTPGREILRTTPRLGVTYLNESYLNQSHIKVAPKRNKVQEK